MQTHLKENQNPMDPTLQRWIIGLTVALIAGWFFTGLFVKVLRWYIRFVDLAEPLCGQRGVPHLVVGTVERLFFTLIVAFDVTAAAVAMIAWLAAKMATGWNRPSESSVGALTGLLGGLVSMLFALIGGLIIRRPHC
jgi:hypothetical protein